MATKEQMLATADKLVDTGGTPLPSRKEIVELYVKQTCKDAIEAAEDAAEYTAKMVEYYTIGVGKAMIDGMINDFNEAYSDLKTGIEDIKTSIANTTAANTVPAVIVAGSATGTPNPAYAVIDNAQKKHVLQMNMRGLKKSARKILTTGANMGFIVPDSTLTMIDGLADISSTIDSIPG